MIRLLRGLIAVVVLSVAAYSLVPQVRVAVLAVALVPHFFPGNIPRPLDRFTPPPQVQTITVPGAPGHMVADVYRPAGSGKKPAMILMLGVNPLPRTDPQVKTLADGIARTGIVTVVAESDALLAGEIRTEEVDNLVALYQFLEQDEGIDATRIGFAGFCVGGVLELLAAEDDRIADRVAYVNAFSVYASARDVLRSILTNTQPGPSGVEPWTPSPLTRSVFVSHLIRQIPSEVDRGLLTSAFLDNATPSTSQRATLSPLGQQLYDAISTHDPANVDALLAALPPAYSAQLDRLSPLDGASRIRAHVFLMHDTDDSFLPVAGARQLAAALPPAAHVRYTELRLFDHVVPGKIDDPKLFAGEMLKLIAHVNAVLQAALIG